MKNLFGLVGLLLLANGCVMSQGPRIPNLIAETQEPAVTDVPSIKLVFGHEHHLEGDHQPTYDEGTSKKFRESLDRIIAESPVLQKASLAPTEPVHYVLFLDTRVNEHGQASAIISGLSLMLIPASVTSDVAVTGSLYEAANGEEVGAYESQGTVEVVIWLPLLPALPVTLALAPGDELYDDTYRDLLIQIAQDLAERQLPEAVPADKLKIREEPVRVKRQISVE